MSRIHTSRSRCRANSIQRLPLEQLRAKFALKAKVCERRERDSDLGQTRRIFLGVSLFNSVRGLSAKMNYDGTSPEDKWNDRCHPEHLPLLEPKTKAYNRIISCIFIRNIYFHTCQISCTERSCDCYKSRLFILLLGGCIWRIAEAGVGCRAPRRWKGQKNWSREYCD